MDFILFCIYTSDTEQSLACHGLLLLPPNCISNWLIMPLIFFLVLSSSKKLNKMDTIIYFIHLFVKIEMRIIGQHRYDRKRERKANMHA